MVQTQRTEEEKIQVDLLMRYMAETNLHLPLDKTSLIPFFHVLLKLTFQTHGVFKC